MSQFFNTIKQIVHCDSVEPVKGICRHLGWQLRRALHRFPCELPIAGSRLYVDRPGGVAALVNAMGEYDFNNMRLLRLVLSRCKGTFIDVGANIGSYTLIASELPGVRVISIEPHPKTFAMLQRNVQRNARRNVVCLNLALSSREGELRITDELEPSINRVVEGDESAAGELRVACQRFDAICRDLQLIPDFVKIDVEGHEDAVLDGFGELAGVVKVIFVEGGERLEVQNWMHRTNYTGPWFLSFNERALSNDKQARPEDPIYVHRDFLPRLQSFGIRTGESLSDTDRSNSQIDYVKTVDAMRSAGAVPATRSSTKDFVPVRAILLTTFVAPYTLPVWQKLTSSLTSLRLMLSTPMEADRHWDRNWDGLDVRVQRSLSVKRKRRHAQAFTVTGYLHFPYDSLPLLFKYSPDVVISAEMGFRTFQAVLFRLVRGRSRLVVWVDGSEHTEKGIGQIRTQLRQVLLHTADAVVVIGAGGVRYLEQLGVPSSKIVQAPYVTDTTSFQAIPLRRGTGAAKRLLYVGQLIERKGLEGFVGELACWLEKNRDNSCELWFVGDGPLRSSLEQLPITRGLQLKFFGNIPYNELPGYYAQADVCVLPTLADTWGLVVNEALASGVPVLGSLYSQAVDELIEDGVNGWTFYPDQEGGTQKVLDRVFCLKGDELDAMREATRQSVRHLTPEFTAQCFVRAIRLALETARA